MATEIEQLRQEAEALKNQIRVSLKWEVEGGVVWTLVTLI